MSQLPPRKYRVMHVVETLDVGGAENVVASIVNQMSDRFESVICCVRHSGAVARRVRPGVKIYEMGKGEGNDYSIPLRLARLLREKRIDVLHAHDWGVFCEAAVAGLLAGVPAKFHLSHGLLYSYPPKDRFSRFKRLVRRAVERALSFTMHRLVAVSDQVRRQLIREVGVTPRRTTVIRNGIDFGAPAEADLAARRAEIGLKPGELLVCAVGRLAAVKNYDSLLRVFPEIDSRVESPVKLAIVGDGPERAKLEALVRKHDLEGRVFLLGERSDARDWLGISDVFVLPSSWEGVSIALLEAMAAGVPAVATAVGGNPEVVRAGETGLLVPAGNPRALADAVVTLLSDEALRARMGEAARTEARREYDLRDVVRRYERLYLDRLEGRREEKVPEVGGYVRDFGNR